MYFKSIALYPGDFVNCAVDQAVQSVSWRLPDNPLELTWMGLAFDTGSVFLVDGTYDIGLKIINRFLANMFFNMF